MMKCLNCGTGWTSPGLMLCPVCGSKVEEPTAGKAPEPALVASREVEAPVGNNGLSVEESTRPEPPKKIEPLPEPEAPRPAPPPSRRVMLPIPEPRPLPIPMRAANGPVILGFLAFVAVVLLPVSILFESNRVIGILGFALCGFFAPFAPIAWIAGLNAEQRAKDVGLVPESRVSAGRVLGQWGTLVLIAEVTATLILVPALRLSGRFPGTFWATGYF